MTLISAYTLLWSYLSAVFHFSIHWIWHLLPIIQRLRPFLHMTVGNKMWFLCLLNLQVYSNIFFSFKLFFFSEKGISFLWSLIIGFTSVLYVCYVLLQFVYMEESSVFLVKDTIMKLILLKWCWNWCVLLLSFIIFHSATQGYCQKVGSFKTVLYS